LVYLVFVYILVDFLYLDFHFGIDLVLEILSIFFHFHFYFFDLFDFRLRIFRFSIFDRFLGGGFFFLNYFLYFPAAGPCHSQRGRKLFVEGKKDPIPDHRKATARPLHHDTLPDYIGDIDLLSVWTKQKCITIRSLWALGNRLILLLLSTVFYFPVVY
jgi:hypothetical protein